MALAISIVCTYMPQIVISMFSGTWGDKFNKKNLIIIGDTITGISTLILAILFINGFDSLYLLYGACALRSVGSGIQTPLEHAFLPLICPEEKLTKINGIYATASSAINILSPAMAGVLLNVMDFGHTLFIDCITALLAIIVLLKLKYKNTISSNKDTSTLSDFLEGVKYFKQHIFLGRLILFYLLFYFFMSAPAFLTPVLVNLKFSSSVNALAINEFVWSLGTMLGGILICSFKEFNKLKFMAISALLFGGFICLLVSSAGLHADTDIFSQLVVDGRDLCLGCGNRDLCLRIRLPDLPVHPLHHGLQAAVFRMKYFDKLLGTDFVGQGPKPLSGAAR